VIQIESRFGFAPLW